MKIFLDTSTLAKRYVQEPGSEELEALFMTVATEVSIATLAWPAFTAALARKVRSREIREESAEGAGFLLICVANQPDVARGRQSQNVVEAIHEQLVLKRVLA